MESWKLSNQQFDKEKAQIKQAIVYAKKCLSAFVQVNKEKQKIQNQLFDIETTKNSLKRKKGLLDKQLNKVIQQLQINQYKVEFQQNQLSKQQQLLTKKQIQTDKLCQQIAKENDYKKNLEKDQNVLSCKFGLISKSQWELLSRIAELRKQVFILIEAIGQIEAVHQHKRQNLIAIEQQINKVNHNKSQKHQIYEEQQKKNQYLQLLYLQLEVKIKQFNEFNQETSMENSKTVQKITIEKQISYELQEKYKIVANRLKRLKHKNQQLVKFKQRNVDIRNAFLISLKERNKQVYSIKSKVQTSQTFYERSLLKNLQIILQHQRSASNISH